MRRRQAYSVAQETAPPPPPPIPLQEEKNFSRRYIDRTEKGVCAKCGKYIGKGIGPHQRFCKG